MDTALPQKFPFNLYRNLAKANCTGNRICTSCDIVVFGYEFSCLSNKIIPCTKIFFTLERRSVPSPEDIQGKLKSLSPNEGLRPSRHVI